MKIALQQTGTTYRLVAPHPQHLDFQENPKALMQHSGQLKPQICSFKKKKYSRKIEPPKERDQRCQDANHNQ